MTTENDREPRSRNLKVTVATERELDVRHMAIEEGISRLFQIDLTVLSLDASLDFDAIVGRPAGFSMEWAPGQTRRWDGYCNRFEQVAAEPDGASTYKLRIVPALWFLTQRRNYRIFQQQTEPDIVLQILRDDWDIKPEVRLDRAVHKTRKYRVQYAESDFHFMCRILEDAGISFFFETIANRTTLVLTDSPHTATPIAPLPVAASSSRRAETVFCVADVRLRQRVRPGRYVMRDHDFRRSADFELGADAQAPGEGVEKKLERFHYAPGAFLFGTSPQGGTPVADDRGAARANNEEGIQVAERRLHAKRGDAVTCEFETTAHFLMPGVVMCMLDHPHADLGPDKGLLVVEGNIEGGHDEEWRHRCRAHLAETPYRPALATRKPRVHGTESATVVGPRGEDIHVDEFGRVRVQFHWDRYGTMDHNSGCWVHVSQPWAGAGYGRIDIPRVGQEVLVDFLNGDPDRPVIVGRVFTALQTAIYKLPENKTRSGWRSNSSPGGDGYNEIMFEDAAGQELFNIQAQKDLTKLVKNSEDVVIGNNRDELVKNDVTETIGQNKAVTVGVNQRTRVGATDTLHVGKRYEASISPSSRPAPTSITMTDEKIVLDTGAGATITLQGDEVIIKANRIRLEGERELVGKVSKGDLSLIGGPMVKVNC